MRLSLFLALVFCSFLSCSGSWQTFYEQEFSGRSLQVQSREVKGFSTNRIEYRMKLQGLPSITIDPLTTDWGPPYSDDIYGTEAYEFFSGMNAVYLNQEDTNAVESTCLYFSKKQFSEEDYETYAAFMRKEWATIDKDIHKNGATHFPHIIGIVYGSVTDFTKEFKGKYLNEDVSFTVENDGRVRLLSKGAEYGMNMSKKIQMPGKRIIMDTTMSGITKTLIQSLKDDKGLDPAQVFQFEYVDSNFFKENKQQTL